MIDLISLDEAKLHLRIPEDFSDSDEDIEDKISHASAVVMNYLKLEDVPEDWYAVDESPGSYVVPQDVKASALLVLSELHENREATTSDPLSVAVKSLLHRRRDPAMA